MLELYVGGTAQGKLSYVKKRLAGCEIAVGSGAAEPAGEPEQILVWDHFHEYIRDRIPELSSEEPDEIASAIMDEVTAAEKSHKGLVVIADEVGSGIVPLQADERLWREVCGRTLCLVAARARHFERVICGCGQVIKE